VSVCVDVLCVFTKNIAQNPVDGRETVKEAFSCTPPEIVSAAKKTEYTLPEHGLLFKNCNHCTVRDTEFRASLSLYCQKI
jgi:hypothetical protein